MAENLTKKEKKLMKATKKRAIILSLLAFGGLSIGSLSFLPFLLKSWNTLQYNIVDFKHINRDNIGYELEFALSDLDSYKLNYQDLNVDFTADEQGKDVIVSHKAIYDEFSRTWRLSSNYNGLSFGKRYYLKVYLDDKKQKRFSAKKVIAFGQNVTNFVDTPPAVSTINFQTKTPSSASVSLKFADEAANLEGKKVALEYYYVLKNQSAPTDVLSNSQEIHTSYVDSATVKNGVAEFSLENLHPGMDYKISAIRYVDSSAPASDIPLVPMQKIALAPQINYEQDAQKEKLFEATTGKYNYRAESLIDQNLSFDSKRLTVNFSTLDSSPNLENKAIKLNYTNIQTGQKFSVSSFFAANLASFDLNNLAPGSSYQIESFELESSKVEFAQTFIKNFHTPAAIVESKIATGATFSKVDLSVVSVDNLEGTKAHLYLDDSSILPVSGVFRKTDQTNSYQISFEPKGLTNKTKYGLSRVVFDALSPNSVFAKNRDGYDYLNLAWDNNLETGSASRNFITSISDLKTFIKLEPKILASKVEYTFGFGLDSSFLNDKELYLYYHKKDEPQKVYKSKASIPQGSEIKFELENFESSTTYKLEKIVISDYPEVAVAINFDPNKKTQQNLPLDEFFVKYYVSDISFENVDQTSARAKVTINGDFKNIQDANLDLNAKIVFGQPGFTNLTETINLNLANLKNSVPVGANPIQHELQDDKLVMYFDLKDLDPKTEYQVADVEILGKTDFFSSEGILDLNARFTTTFQKVKIIGANFESINLTSANASIYIDPNFNRYLNGKQFNAIFKSEDNQEVKSVPLDSAATPDYSVLTNNILSVKLDNLSPGKKYTFFKLEPAPGQDEAFDNLEYKFIDLNQQETDDLPYFYTLSDIASISVQPTQDSAKLVVNFTTKDPNYNKRANSSLKKAVIFLKNNATGTVASAQADQIKYEDGLNKVEFDVQNLDKLSHYTVSEILLDGQKIEFNKSLKEESTAQRNFVTVASTAKIIKVVQTAQSHNKMAIELSFDPVSDTFLSGDNIKVVLQNSKDKKTIEASGTVDSNLVLKLNFDKEVEAGSEYSILSITNETKNKDIQTSVGFLLQKRLDNYNPNLEKTSIQSEKFYSSPELKTFSVTSNANETVKVKLTFADAQKLLLQNVAGTKKQLTLLIKNTQTNAIVASSAEAKEQGNQIEADFTFSNLDRAVKYELVSVNDYSRPDYLIFKDDSNFTDETTKTFVVNVDSIEVKNLVYSDIKQNSVKAEIYFDPIRDSYLAGKEIDVEIQQDGDPVAQLVNVDALVQSQTTTKKTVQIQRLDDGRLRAEIVFGNLAEGKDFKIALLSLANKQDVQTNDQYKASGPKFKIVNDFLAQGDPNTKSAEITADSNQKTLKFATDVVVSNIEFNPADSTTNIDKQQSAKIKVEFSNSNNEILKLKNDQLATLTLINKLTGKIVLASAKIKAKESVAGQKAETSASVEFEFNNNLEKLTKYEVSSISVVRANGIYSIPFAASIANDPKTFVTQLTTVSVKNISYVDVSETSVELTVFFDSVNDDILNEQFEAELEYVLKTKDTEVKKSSKVVVSNNQAVFTIENLDEASTYEVKDLKLSKKVLTRSTRSLGRRVRRSAPEASPVANNINVVFDKTEVEDKHKKLFSTKSLISEIKIDKTLLEQELATKMPGLTLEQTNLTDTQAGIELKIKDPKQFFKDYVSGPKAASAESDIKLVVKSNRTDAISQAGAQIAFDEAQNVATVKFLLEDLEKYTVYSIVDIFVNGVRLGFLNTLTESQKEFATTARDVTPNYIAQTEFKRHGAVLRMVFDINKNWFLVNNKVRLTFKKFQAAGADDPDLSVETTVDQDGLAVFRINKDNLAAKVPVGSCFWNFKALVYSRCWCKPKSSLNSSHLNTVTSTDSTKTHSASQSSSLVPLACSRCSLSVFDSSSSGASQFQDNAQPQLLRVPRLSGSALQVLLLILRQPSANTNFLDVNISTSPLQDPTVPSSAPAPAVKTTFDTASFISAVEKVNLSGTNAELRITLNSTLLLDAQSPTIKLKYIDITHGQEHKADLIGCPVAGSSTSQYTFRANNLKTLNYYQIVSVNYADNNNAEQVIAFDDKSVKYEDKLFRTTPTSFSVKKIESAYNSSKKLLMLKLPLMIKLPQYLENYTVRVSYQRIDKTNANTTVASVNGIINSDSTVSVELSGNYTDANQKDLLYQRLLQDLTVDCDTNTLSSKPRDIEQSISTQDKRIDQNKLFETYNYKITKVELVQKPSSSSGRAKRSVSVPNQNLVDFNSNYNFLATFDRDKSQGNQAINETSIIQTSPIALYDQLIYVEEKDKFSGIDATIYAYFISSEDLSDQDSDKNNFRVQLYNESLKNMNKIRKASSIKKLNDSGRQTGASHFYVATFETNLNKASLYNIEFFAYKDQKIELSEYKTTRVDKSQFTTPGKKAWLTNFSQVGAYQDEAANVIFQFDEKDEYLWRNKHKVELEITEKLDQPTPATPPRRGSRPVTPPVTKFSFIPDGPISRVTIDNINSQDRSALANLAPNKTYEITKFTIKEATLPDAGGALSNSNSNLKIKTVDTRSTVTATTLGAGQMEVAKFDSVEVENFPADQKIPFFETKAQFAYQEATNFSQNDNTDADGRSATLEFNFNKHFLQIPRSFATITIVRSDATTADQKEISFISQEEYDPAVGRVTFKLNNLDRFHTYDIKNFEIGGVKIDHLASSTTLKFTPTVQKIFLADLEVTGLKTGTTGTTTPGNTGTAGSSPSTSGSAQASAGLNPTKEDGSKVFGNVSLYFDNDNSFLDGARFDVKIKNKNNNRDITTIRDLPVTKDLAKKATPYKVDIDLAQRAPNQIQPGTKIGFEFTLKGVSSTTDLKGRRPEDIVVAVPERQYNLEYAPKLESEVIIPTVIESLVVSNLTDTSAKLKIKLKGDPANFERVVNNPVVLSIQPDPNNQTTNKIPITLITQSQVTTFKDKSRFEIEYDLDNLIPNLEYKILKLQGQDLEIPFGEDSYKLKLEQGGSAQQNASNDAKVFKTSFTELSPERIILTQATRTNPTSGKEYSPENLTLNLDPVSMWSLNDKQVKVKFKPLGPNGTELKSGDNNNHEREYDFRVRFDQSKNALVAELTNQDVTDANDANFYPSTTYKITQIQTVERDPSKQLTLSLDNTQTTAAAPNTNNLEFTTQLAQPPLVKAGITNFYNHSGKENTFEQTIYFAFDDPYFAIDQSSMKDWKLILEGVEDKNKGNNAQDARNWIQVAKYEPNNTGSLVELYNPRELIGPPVEYTENPEVQRLLIEKDDLEQRIKVIENDIQNFETQDNKRIELLKKLATTSFQAEYKQQLIGEGIQIKKAIEKQKAELERQKNSLDSIKSLVEYHQELNQLNSKNTLDNPYRRYFAFSLKGDASWLSYYKMRVAIQYKYFKDNDNRTQSDFSKIISNINTNQTDNRNQSREAYSSNSASSQTTSVSRIQTIELDDFAKYTNRILLKKSEIKPLNQIGAYIEMEFEDPKLLLAPLKDQFSRAQIQGTNDLAKWIELSSNIRFDNQSGIIKNPGSLNNQPTYKVDAINDDGSSAWSRATNQWTANNSSSYNLDFDVKVYDYDLSNPFGSLLNNPNQKYVDLVKKIPKVVYPKTTLRENHIRNKFYSLRLAKFEVNDSGLNKTVKIGLIITYHYTSIDNFSKKIISIYPKILSNLLTNSTNVKNFEPLVPTLSDKVNLTFMTSPIIQKEDPYWGNFWANPSGNVWHGSEVRQYDKSRGQTGLIIDAFQRSIFQKMYNDFNDRATNKVDYSKTFFIGPTGPVKTLIPKSGNNNNPTSADFNIAGQIYGTNYAGKDMATWLNEVFAKQTRHPFGIRSAEYRQAEKWLRIEFNTPDNAIRSGVRLQEIMPTVSYATFVDQSGKIYLFGNKNGLPIRLQDDINVNDRTLWINLAPANWSEYELPKAGTNLNFMGLLVFPYLPPDFTQNRFLQGDVGGNIYKANQQYKIRNLSNGKSHNYLLPVKGYDGLQVDAENPYFIPWVSNDDAWLRITY
ncbi:hypothetical protein [Mesomycoplasma ovipneumoniae]|uniref:hypothetical protein n=1 Tax=Mesomycoplasma ovipneumoniae TaxID=29562 RepID=UPI0028AA9113|nr:hypothetical protein [Mesomycoplasma ovipneumoniae]WNM15502.1 hypothetical protein RNM12_02105 [Mesomycoplasma ovipneumoniae]